MNFYLIYLHLCRYQTRNTVDELFNTNKKSKMNNNKSKKSNNESNKKSLNLNENDDGIYVKKKKTLNNN